MKLDPDFSTCKVCGGHIGRGFDHSECSEFLKETQGKDKERKRRKKLSQQQCDSLGKFFSDK